MSELRRPLPRLPWDVLVNIFEQASPSALAALGGVSLDFFGATAPLLYGGEVVITSYQGLLLLFCDRDERDERETLSISRVSSVLSLSQIQILTLDFGHIDALPVYGASDLSLFSSRIDGGNTSIPSPTPIPLQVLNLTLTFTQLEYLSAFRWSLFRWLNPARFNSTVLHRPTLTMSWLEVRLLHPISHWDRLTTVDIKGVLPYIYYGDEKRLLGLPPPSLRVVRLHLNSLRQGRIHQGENRFLRYLYSVLGNGAGGPLFATKMQTGGIVLVAESEEERRDFEEVVAMIRPLSIGEKFKAVVD